MADLAHYLYHKRIVNVMKIIPSTVLWIFV